MMLAAVNSGKRRTAIAVAGDGLLIISDSIFGRKRREWLASQIDQIRCGDSGVEVNDVPLKELQIHPRSGRKFGLLSERSEEELRWLAYELNQALNVEPHRAPGILQPDEVSRDAAGLAVPAPDSRISILRGGGSTRIEVPPLGFRKYGSFIGMGTVFVLVTCGVFVAVFSQGGFAWEKAIFFALWGTLFGGLGLAMWFGGMIAACRAFDVEVNRSQLRVTRRGLLGTRRFQWHRDRIAAVRIADSQTKVNKKTLYQVQIKGAGKSDCLSFMTGAPRADLSLVVTAICEELKLPGVEHSNERHEDQASDQQTDQHVYA
jgi:hypothetical protein